MRSTAGRLTGGGASDSVARIVTLDYRGVHFDASWESPRIYQLQMRTEFEPFTLDTGTRELLKGGQAIHLSPKAFDVLALLVERRPNVITKKDFDDRIWPGVFVSDANLSVIVSEIRRALGDTPRDQLFIRTVDRVGYAFSGRASDVAAAPASSPAVCRLSWTGGHVGLGVGEHVVGRNPACGVWLDFEGVSRTHARVRIDQARQALVEDLGSTNGTFVRGVAIDGPTSLRDGDVIQIGTAELTFRAWADRPTERIRRS
jgi:DNA-binding winged helix-turn-helix (wHTH) protein